MKDNVRQKFSHPLYSPDFEHDNCGIGAVVDIKGRKTHATVDGALKIVENLEHRAGKDAEGKTGDGVGILLQVGHKFFKKVTRELGFIIGGEREYGVGMFFFSQKETIRKQSMKLFETIVKKEGMEFLGWREVPVCPEILGKSAIDCMPSIWQGFVARPEEVNTDLEFDRKLYIVRRVFGQADKSYVASLSCRTIVYKGMFLVEDLRKFYCDMQDSDYESAVGMVHSRFSTNTNPSWERAHPNRFILHNGEINTIKGNADLMLAREETISSEYIKGSDIAKVLPIVNTSGSDSAMLDNAIEFMVMNGMELPLAIMVTIPEPWENDEHMSSKKRDLYGYYATMLEPWDGPASILFSDGDVMGAVLDRNGLRPSRYIITKDDQLILSSEVGVLDIPAENIVKKDRLRPGKMLLVDMVNGVLIDDNDVKEDYASRQPYGHWLSEGLVKLSDIKIPNIAVEKLEGSALTSLQKAFGYSYEDVTKSILHMAKTGGEEISAMGIDTPLAPLSERQPPLFDYFKQMFAQVTNPPIDAIREEIVTSTTVYVGKGGNLLCDSADNCSVLKVKNPILTETDMMKIKNLKNHKGVRVETISTVYYKGTDLKVAIDKLFVEVDKAYMNGASIVILSDRGIDEYHIAIPSLLAVSAVSKYLVRTRKRTALALVLETAEPRTVHHFATLLGYGACAVNPYLAHETIRDLIATDLLEKDYYAAVDDYNDAVLHGIVKIASKMGISTIQSYQGSQIFEAVGIDESVVNKYFFGTVSRVGGMKLADIQESIESKHHKAFDPLGLDTNSQLESIGAHKFRADKEEHLYNPKTIHMLQKSLRSGDYAMFKEYTKLIDNEGKTHFHLRSLLDFHYAEEALDLSEVEPASEIVKRFKTGAMSYGSISGEAHETMAIAMNRLGGKSNTGEGGEAISRLTIGKDGLNRCSAIKQVASGRFGVTSRYLSSAKEIQIKMAQGAKPGEGGHLPGGKVYPWIAKTRNSTTGVGLISPPPHHDIYSIEDLAQLIYDLKSANRRADISVKLVSEAGVGTIASGVAKAGARNIVISGYDGGTGAAPINSISFAGNAWELGLSEAHQTLIANGLRSRVRLETDGKLMSGRDLAIAAILGADEFAFATVPLVAMGCVMMRVCNLDTCPVGVATQNPELRKRFQGKPEHVENFMMFVAEQLREYMAKLGVRTVSDLVGRYDLLFQKEVDQSKKAAELNLSKILNNPYLDVENAKFNENDAFDYELEKTKDMTVLMPTFKSALKNKTNKKLTIDVVNTDRSFGTIFGSEITLAHPEGLSEDTFVVKCNGSGGQSFGAFIPSGLTLELEGDSNDYIGKGLSGGKIVVYPPKKSTFVASENIIIGNVALYGATSGKLFASGIAGERFCVRNSGAYAVVEGVGDHGCEYMTGGRVVVLGSTGKNFAAGMSGGIAYVFDEAWDLYQRVNKEMVSISPLSESSDIECLKEMIAEHVEATNSARGKEVLDNFDLFLPKFKKVMPYDYDRMMKMIAKMEEKGHKGDRAEVEAFYAIKK